MIAEVDTRDYLFRDEISRDLDSNAARASALSAELPADETVSVSSVNRLTGSPRVVTVERAEIDSGSLVDQALTYARRSKSVFGFAPAEELEFLPDPQVVTTSSGGHIVHLHQHHQGILIFEMSRSVRFSEQNTIHDIIGDNVSITAELETIPSITAVEAMQAANSYINVNQSDTEETDGWGQAVSSEAVDTSDYVPKVLITFSQPNQPTVLEKGVFDEHIPAHLTYFHQGPRTRLSWHFVITLPERKGQYVIIVSADRASPGEILYLRSVNLHAKAEGRVYTTNGDITRELIPFPRPLTDYPKIPTQSLPTQFPTDWVEDGATSGNNVTAIGVRLDGVPVPALAGSELGGTLTFDPTDATGAEQKILNIFYFCNYMHNFFYMLGFDEASGNFQTKNLVEGGLGGDPVDARAWDGPVNGTANMLTRPDGWYPEMNMGLVVSTNRHTAFDADVVFHEYAHGVTNRLIGGRMNAFALQAEQSRGMGEGWSDYFALTIQNYFRSSEKSVVGDWVTNRSGGIRKFPYTESFPDDFSKLGRGRFTRFDAPHNAGEIWCATLMSMTRRVVQHLGYERGYFICWQIVVDGLKLSPANPSFIDARDAIFLALDELRNGRKISQEEHRSVRRSAWDAFAKFGMGANASSMGPNILEQGIGIHSDYDLPGDLQ